MKRLTTKRTLSAVGGALAATLVIAANPGAIMAAEGDDQVQSLSAPLLNLETPDPAIAEGLEVFDQKGSVMGRLTEVVDRGGERFAIVSPVQWTTNEQRTVTVPYKSLKVVNGIVTYSPE